MPHAFVTGTSMGLGRLAAEGLVARGWTVTGAMRDPSRAAAEDPWETLPLDLSDEAREQPRFVGRMFLPKRWRWAAPWAAGYFDVG